jgi:hypothetical protein
VIAEQPGDDLAEVELHGCPWHGKVQGGLLTLPNAATMDWPQPDGRLINGFGDHFRWHRGFTFKQSMPWAVAPSRTEAQAIEDAAAGRQYLTSAILAGAKGQAGDNEPNLHSVGIAGWLYAAPNNTVWKMNTTGPWSWSGSTAASLNLNPRRFGAFNVASEVVSYTKTISAADMQQTTPSLSTEQGFGLRVVDITPDGSKAILLVYRLYSSGLDVEPVGFILLTLTGTPGIDFSAAVSVLASRAATLGTSEVTANTLTITGYFQSAEANESIEDTRTAFPECAGYLKRTYTFTEVLTTDGSDNIVVASGGYTYSYTDRIIGYWFDSAGSPHPVKCTTTMTYTIDQPAYTVTCPGSLIITQYNSNAGAVCILGAPDQTSDAELNFTRTATRTTTCSFTMEWNGNAITYNSEASASSTIEGSYPIISTEFGSPIGPGTWATSTASETVTMNGSTVFSGSSTASDFVDLHNKGGESIAALTTEQQANAFGSGGSLTTVMWYDPAPLAIAWSNNLYGGGWYYDPPGGMVIKFKGLHPMGVTAEQDASAFYDYGSFNPITGESACNSATPVSWV